jgi:two-component system LytT family sensor kinase
MSPTRRRIARLAALAMIIVFSWLVAGAFVASEDHLIEVGYQRPDSLYERMLERIAQAMLSATITPLVIYIAERLRLRRPHRLRNALLLFIASLTLAVFRGALDTKLLSSMGDAARIEDRQKVFYSVTHTHLVFIWVIVTIENLVVVQREARERRGRQLRFEGELAKARLRRLRADLQPHFLFNTLNAVAALLHSDPVAAERTIDTLSDLLRRSLAAADRLEVTLAEDLEFVERYLDLQKTRFGERLRATISVSRDELLEARIPPLLLQPLVENSIVHGISPRPGGGQVDVRVFSENGWLRLQVRDDGPGADPEGMFRGGSVGVPNTRARLQYLYHDPDALTFRYEGDVFVADVRLPLVFAP